MKTWAEVIIRVEHLIQTLGVDAAPLVAAEVADWIRADEKRIRERTTINSRSSA